MPRQADLPAKLIGGQALFFAKKVITFGNLNADNIDTASVSGIQKALALTIAEYGG